MYLRGSMQATTTPGLFQRSALPTGGTLVLGDSGALPSSSSGALTNFAPGHGGVDWESLIRALNGAGYDGPTGNGTPNGTSAF